MSKYVEKIGNWYLTISDIADNDTRYQKIKVKPGNFMTQKCRNKINKFLSETFGTYPHFVRENSLLYVSERNYAEIVTLIESGYLDRVIKDKRNQNQ